MSTKKHVASVPHHEATLAELRTDRAFAVEYLRLALEELDDPGHRAAGLLALRDARITQGGVVVIKAQRSRSLEQNKEDALRRLQALVDRAAEVPPERRATRPTRASQRRRLDAKARSGQVKALRGKVNE